MSLLKEWYGLQAQGTHPLGTSPVQQPQAFVNENVNAWQKALEETRGRPVSLREGGEWGKD